MLFLSLATLLLCAFTAKTGGTSLNPAAYGCLAAGLLLDLVCCELGTFGLFSLGAAGPIAAALLCPKGRGAIAILALLVLAIRTLFRGAPNTSLRRYEFCLDAFCVSASLASTLLLPRPEFSAPAVLSFLWVVAPSLLYSSIPEEFQDDWTKYRSGFLWGGAAAACGAIALYQTGGEPVSMIWPILLLLFLSRSIRPHVANVDAVERQVAQREKDRSLTLLQQNLDETSDRLQVTGQQQQQSAAELEVRLESYTLVEKMLEGLAGQTAPEEVALAILDRIRRKIPVQTLVLFWRQDTGEGVLSLTPLAWRTPLEDRLKASALLQVHEPVVERALRLQRMEQGLTPDNDLDRIFPEETQTWAIPMRNRGIIYLGHTKTFEIDAKTKHFLQVISNHSVVALESAQFYQRLQRSLQREATSASRSEALVQRLAQVIDCITQLVDLQTPDEMLERCSQTLQQLIPHKNLLMLRNADAKLNAPELRKPEGPSPLEGYAQKVRENGRPLLLEEFRGSNFAAPMPQATSLLGAPMTTERGVIGTIVLVRCGGAPFSREDQDILSVLAYQLGAALSSAQLFIELQETHKALKESQAKVVQSTKMAAVGQLAGGVAHELNTPLGAIALAIDGALNALKTKPDRAESRLQRAAMSVSQMKEIVSKLLFYSRDARSGRRETNLNQVIDDTLQLIGHQLRMDRVEVETNLAELPTFMANQNELQQVFTNLCMNARDAVLMPEAVETKIWITTSVQTDANGEVWLRANVRDSGCGMTAAVKEKIFDPFYTTKDVGKGTGLGLSVTLELLQQHGAKVNVFSAPGKGTEFQLLFPQNPPDEIE